MQNRSQNEVKVAVYTEQLSVSERATLQDRLGVICLGLGMLMAVWVNTAF